MRRHLYARQLSPPSTRDAPWWSDRTSSRLQSAALSPAPRAPAPCLQLASPFKQIELPTALPPLAADAAGPFTIAPAEPQSVAAGPADEVRLAVAAAPGGQPPPRPEAFVHAESAKWPSAEQKRKILLNQHEKQQEVAFVMEELRGKRILMDPYLVPASALTGVRPDNLCAAGQPVHPVALTPLFLQIGDPYPPHWVPTPQQHTTLLDNAPGMTCVVLYGERALGCRPDLILRLTRKLPPSCEVLVLTEIKGDEYRLLESTAEAMTAMAVAHLPLYKAAVEVEEAIKRHGEAARAEDNEVEYEAAGERVTAARNARKAIVVRAPVTGHEKHADALMRELLRQASSREVVSAAVRGLGRKRWRARPIATKEPSTVVIQRYPVHVRPESPNPIPPPVAGSRLAIDDAQSTTPASAAVVRLPPREPASAPDRSAPRASSTLTLSFKRKTPTASGVSPVVPAERPAPLWKRKKQAASRPTDVENGAIAGPSKAPKPRGPQPKAKRKTTAEAAAAQQARRTKDCHTCALKGKTYRTQYIRIKKYNHPDNIKDRLGLCVKVLGRGGVHLRMVWNSATVCEPTASTDLLALTSCTCQCYECAQPFAKMTVKEQGTYKNKMLAAYLKLHPETAADESDSEADESETEVVGTAPKRQRASFKRPTVRDWPQLFGSSRASS